MTGVDRRFRGFMLLEMLAALTVAAVVFFALGRLMLDGIRLERIAAEHANREAITSALVQRLRTDALGADSYAWQEDEPLTLTLKTCADGSRRTVDWVFGQGEVRRIVSGRETDGFRGERLGFSAYLVPARFADCLVLGFETPPPKGSKLRQPRLCSVCVALPPRPALEGRP